MGITEDISQQHEQPLHNDRRVKIFTAYNKTLATITFDELDIIQKSHHTQFIEEMLSILFVTFVDEDHKKVDATCMVDVSSESGETLYDTIAKSGVQVRH